MYQIHCLNKISPIGTGRFGDNYTVGAELAQADAVLVRSAAMHDMELPESLLAIARAGAGVNNIPIDKCSEKGIVVFNTPGANANAVKELVVCGLLLASRKIAKGMDWVKTLKGEGEQVGKLVEKGIPSEILTPTLKDWNEDLLFTEQEENHAKHYSFDCCSNGYVLCAGRRDAPCPHL